MRKTTHVRKAILYGTGLLFMVLASLTSCTKIPPPEPSENPVYLTSDAQTHDTWIKNLQAIGAENPETDIVEFNNVISPAENLYLWERIKNDWITLYMGDGVPSDVVRITVTENTSPNPRCYVLTVYNKIWSSQMTIVQMGKTN